MRGTLTASCPQCGKTLPMFNSEQPDTLIKCPACGAELGTVGDALKGAEKAFNEVGEAISIEFGHILGPDET